MPDSNATVPVVRRSLADLKPQDIRPKGYTTGRGENPLASLAHAILAPVIDAGPLEHRTDDRS